MLKESKKIIPVALGLVLAMISTAMADTTGKVFVAGDGSGNIAVIDAHTNQWVENITVGSEFSAPHNLVVGPNNRYVWATLKGAGEVAKIDALNNTFLGTYSTGGATAAPVHLDISQDGNWLYVVNKGSADVVKNVSKISTATGNIIGSYEFTPTINFNPHDINISPDGNSVWVTDEKANSVMVLDSDLNAVETTIGAGERPIQVTFSADGSKVFVTNYNDPQAISGNLGTVSVIDVLTRTVVNTFDMGGSGSMGPMGAVVSPDGSSLWLTGTAGNTVHRHSLVAGDNYSYTATDNLLAAHGLDISDDGNFLYTSVKETALSGQRDALAVINAADGTLVTTLLTPGATNLHGLAYVNPVPVPAAVWLFGTALIGLAGFARCRKMA